MDISASRSESGFRHPSEMPEVRVINLGGGNSAHSVNDRKVGKYVDFEEREQDGVPIKCRSIKKIAVNALIGVAVVGTVGSVIVASPVLAVYDVVRAGMEYIVPNCSLLGAVVTLIAIACVSPRCGASGFRAYGYHKRSGWGVDCRSLHCGCRRCWFVRRDALHSYAYLFSCFGTTFSYRGCTSSYCEVLNSSVWVCHG